MRAFLYHITFYVQIQQFNIHLVEVCKVPTGREIETVKLKALTQKESI